MVNWFSQLLAHARPRSSEPKTDEVEGARLKEPASTAPATASPEGGKGAVGVGLQALTAVLQMVKWKKG